jgi:hypothetical protein
MGRKEILHHGTILAFSWQTEENDDMSISRAVAMAQVQTKYLLI